MIRDCSVEKFLENKHRYTTIDVRSPGEFADSHIPGSVNIPLFTNEERALIGTLYKQEGQKEAKWKAMEIVSPKIPDMLARIQEIEESGREPMVYCWRGGMRSQSVATFATLAGLHVRRIEGGYRAYREHVIEHLSDLIPDEAVVITGMTGTGKTDILQHLKTAGYPVLDLEKYANHKGSVFGSIGGEAPHNQKMFDALLFEDLKKLKGSPYFIMEGESKRIGHAVQPTELAEKKLKGLHITVYSSIEKRMERIYEQYVKPYEHSDAFHERVELALKMIIKRIKSFDIQMELLRCVEERDYLPLIRLLMEHYYDPRYSNKVGDYENPEIFVCSDSILEATNKIAEIIEQSRRAKIEV
ncbi:tRNA 2-selenouridine(34) synthase MnmH [Robertmurraya beringensis]|uniref:tRNA 2-selenouridine(34) synthase MnmH n=1 Tax=Robertmurraya beringensis TaxID=641660 RepID=A0ABV6KRC9_9BACI